MTKLLALLPLLASLQLTLAATAPSTALADPPAGTMDIDAMEAKYKDMPGGDKIIQQLEAHRTEIEAAQKRAAAAQASPAVKDGMVKARAAQDSMAASAPKGPLKSSSEILAMIPDVPKSVSEAKGRAGTDGDLKSQDAQHEINQIMKKKAADAYAQPPQAPSMRAIDDEQGKAIRALGQQAQKSNSDAQAWMGQMHKIEDDAKKAMLQSVSAISKDAAPKINDACNDTGEGGKSPTAAQCKPLIAARNVRSAGVRDGYLAKLSPQIAEYKKKAQQMIDDCSKVRARMHSAFGDENTAPTASTYLTLMDNSQMLVLGGLISVNNSATAAGAAQDPSY